MRATLDACYVAAAAVLVAGSGALLIVRPALPLSLELIGLALVTSAINGLFDYSTGLLRAAFADRTYARLVVVKNALALCLIAGGAVLFGSAELAMVGGALSLGGAVLLTRSSLAEGAGAARLACWPLARHYLAYAVPIVAANLLYLLVPLVNRTIVTHIYGFAETGQFSLAWDFGQRALQAVGSAMDVVLFQMAVAAHARHGAQAARREVARNLGLVIAVLLPATIGLWLVLPSLERLIVPADFRGPFAHYLTLLLPGLFALCITSYGINPAFQIEKKTGPMIVAAVIGCLGTPAVSLLWPHAPDATALALGQSGAYIVAALVLVVLAVTRAGLRFPPGRDLLAATLGCVLLVLTGVPLRQLAPGIGTLLIQITVGTAGYGLVAILLDLGGVRAMVQERPREMGALGQRRTPGLFTPRKP